MAQWELGSTVVALIAVLIAINPLLAKCLSALYGKYTVWRFPDRAMCKQLLWADIQNHVHNHIGNRSQIFCDRCLLSVWQHENVRLCWEKTAAFVFNNLKTRTHYRKKPFQLPLGSSFLRTEARVVLAYLIVTVRCSNFKIEQYLDCRRLGDLAICHLRHPNRVMTLKKEEIDRILEGWPPFYRKSFISSEGHALEYPLTRYELCRRPGWIVAVGLGCIQPTDICVDSGIFQLPCDRVKTMLSDVFLKVWPGDLDIKEAIEMIGAIKKTGSMAYPEGFEDAGSAEPYTISYPKTLPHLTKEECLVTMQVFNDMRIDDGQKRILEPALRKVLSRVCIGFAAVTSYRGTINKRLLVVPDLLRGENKIVYLRDCWTEE